MNSPMQMALPDVPMSFPDLERLTDQQLERLLRDSVALDMHINALDSVQAMVSLRDMQRETNAQTATKNVQAGVEALALQKQAETIQSELRCLLEEVSVEMIYLLYFTSDK